MVVKCGEASESDDIKNEEPEKSDKKDEEKTESKEPARKDEYVLRDVLGSFVSDDCLTPYCPPRTTQTTVAKFLCRTDGKNEMLGKDTELDPRILDSWTKKARHDWLPKPGKEDHFIHEIVRKYSINYDYNPRSLPQKKLIPRSYSVEYDCIEANWQEGMKRIIKKNTEIPIVEVEPPKRACELQSPFWWKKETEQKEVFKHVEKEAVEQIKRWKPRVEVSRRPFLSDCERKIEITRTGLPFKHEACKFYNEHHPAPDIKLFPIKFSK